MKYTYPACKTVDTVEDWFGTSLPDPYSWLRDARDPEVLNFVAQENACTDAYFDSEELAAKIAQLKAEKLPDLYSGLTPWKNGYLGTLRKEGKVFIQILDSSLQYQADFPEIPALEGYDIFGVQPCPTDGSILGIFCQKFGAARPSVAVCREEGWQLLNLMDGIFSYCWSKQDGCLYYSSTIANWETQESVTKVFRYNPVTGMDTLMYEEPEYAIFGMVDASKDGAWILGQICKDYSVGKWIAINTRTGKVITLTDEMVEWVYIDTIQDSHYFVTLSEALNGAVIQVKYPEEARIVLPESERILESGFSCDGKLYILAKQDVSSRLMELTVSPAYDTLSGSAAVESSVREVALPSDMGTIMPMGEGKENIFLRYESFVDAPQILSFDGKEMKAVCATREGGHPDIVVEQHFAPSIGDGKKIPYYLVRRKDQKPEGNAAVLMYGYGGYNAGMQPSYMEVVSQTQIPRWVENGGIYIHCNLRGGNEYGPSWHEDGMAMNKRHCYEDFIGIAEDVIQKGWTCAGRIAISGCSNGGLLMSALVTMRPDLWGCVIDSVPHTDMIHFSEDDRGPMYVTEYGNPRDSKEMFEYLLSYSPYHNIRRENYPPTYIQTGERDNNVPPYHGKKFAARMQAANQSENPILLRVLAEGSHDRGKGDVFWKTIAEMHLFMEEHCPF